uniref:Uncharacterized protein n=1 Tax=Panagrolaimus superbus TaxID=310955 RepID=A0A914YB97_9BILA
MVAEQKEAQMKKTFAKLMINDTENNDFSALILNEIELKVAEFKAKEAQTWKAYTDLINYLRNDPFYSRLKDPTELGTREHGVKFLTSVIISSCLIQQNIPPTYPPPHSTYQQSSPPNSSFSCSPADLFRYRFEEARQIMNNFAGFHIAQQAIILSQIAYATGNWTLEQKQQYDNAHLNHHFTTTGTSCSPFPDVSMIRHLLQPVFPPPLPSNPFKNNPVPRGFLTNALAQQSLKSSHTVASQDSYVKTFTSAGFPNQTSASHQPPLNQHSNFNVLSTSQNSTVNADTHSTNKPTSSANFFPSLISAQTDGKETGAAYEMTNTSKTVNEAFRLAFEHWRGISADTPEVNF